MDYEQGTAITGLAGNDWNIAAQQEKAAMLDCSRREYTLKDRLIRQREQSQAETARLTELIGLLESNPAIQRVLELMGKG